MTDPTADLAALRAELAAVNKARLACYDVHRRLHRAVAEHCAAGHDRGAILAVVLAETAGGEGWASEVDRLRAENEELGAAVRDLTASNAHSLALLAACEARADGLARTVAEVRRDERKVIVAYLRQRPALRLRTGEYELDAAAERLAVADEIEAGEHES